MRFDCLLTRTSPGWEIYMDGPSSCRLIYVTKDRCRVNPGTVPWLKYWKAYGSGFFPSRCSLKCAYGFQRRCPGVFGCFIWDYLLRVISLAESTEIGRTEAFGLNSFMSANICSIWSKSLFKLKLKVLVSPLIVNLIVIVEQAREDYFERI